MATEREDQLRAQTETEVRQLEERAATEAPGILDVLRAYGDFDAAMRQADEYFALVNPIPRFTASDSSGK